MRCERGHLLLLFTKVYIYKHFKNTHLLFKKYIFYNIYILNCK